MSYAWYTPCTILLTHCLQRGSKAMERKQAGFTLVEIAIVLVIIGLLLGGILKGQELIKSAQVRNLIDQSSSIQAAYYGFVDRYHQIPGDMKGNAACKLIGNQVPNCVGRNGNRVIQKNNRKEA